MWSPFVRWWHPVNRNQNWLPSSSSILPSSWLGSQDRHRSLCMCGCSGTGYRGVPHVCEWQGSLCRGQPVCLAFPLQSSRIHIRASAWSQLTSAQDVFWKLLSRHCKHMCGLYYVFDIVCIGNIVLLFMLLPMSWKFINFKLERKYDSSFLTFNLWNSIVKENTLSFDLLEGKV